MSKVIKPTGYRPLSHIVQTDDGNLYMVDSNNTRDHGYETMVFPWSKYCEWYKSDSDMSAGHKRICEDLEKYLEEETNEN